MAAVNPHSLYYDKMATANYFSPAADYLRVVGNQSSDAMTATTPYSLFQHPSSSSSSSSSQPPAAAGLAINTSEQSMTSLAALSDVKEDKSITNENAGGLKNVARFLMKKVQGLIFRIDRATPREAFGGESSEDFDVDASSDERGGQSAPGWCHLPPSKHVCGALPFR